MIFKPLTTDADLQHAFPLMSSLRDRIREDSFIAEVRRQQRDGYELIGGFDEGRLVTLAGIRRSHTLSRGEHLFVDDLVTDESVRGKGYGTRTIAWLVERARGEGIPRIYLDSRNTARGFYERVGFTFHTSIPCWIDVTKGGTLNVECPD